LGLEPRNVTFRSTDHSRTGINTILVPRQTNGDDCGFSVCMFADALSTDRSITECIQQKVARARELICDSLLRDHANFLLASEDTLHLPMELTSATLTNNADLSRGIMTQNPTTLESPHCCRSARTNKYVGNMTEPTGLPWNHNSHRLQIQSIPGMGWCLFASDHFRNEEDIAVYAEKKLTETEARSDKLKSVYDVELGDLFIDAWDAKANLCKAFAGYANDAINREGRRDCWNAEFVIDPY
jgi:hypothetical protein